MVFFGQTSIQVLQRVHLELSTTKSSLIACTGTGLDAELALDAFALVKLDVGQRGALERRAVTVFHVCLILVAEVADRGKRGIRRGLPEGAQRAFSDFVADVFEEVDVFRFPFAGL